MSATGGQSESIQTKEITVQQPTQGRITHGEEEKRQDQLKKIQNLSRHPPEQRGLFPLLVSSRSQPMKEFQMAERAGEADGHQQRISHGPDPFCTDQVLHSSTVGTRKVRLLNLSNF